MQMTYRVPVWGNGPQALESLIPQGGLIPLHNPAGPIYQASGPIALQDLCTLLVQGVPVTADVYRLPTAPLRALLTASPDAQLYDITRLAWQLDHARGPVRDWWPQVLAVVREGPATGRPLPTGPLDQAAQWRPEDTRFHRQGTRWMVTLAFDVQTHWGPRGLDGVVGIDVGSAPLATARGGGLRLTLPGVWSPDGDMDARRVPEDLRAAARHVSRTAVYAVARRRWESLIGAVLPQASVVAVERLDARSLQRRFKWQCLDLGIQDALLAWWPQLAHASGVRLVRVDPALTSLTCARCVRPGTREGAILTCPVHGDLDVHGNAAEVIAILGAAKILGERQAQAARRRGQ